MSLVPEIILLDFLEDVSTIYLSPVIKDLPQPPQIFEDTRGHQPVLSAPLSATRCVPWIFMG